MEHIHSVVIEDDLGVRCFLCELLRLKGHKITTIPSPSCLCPHTKLSCSCRELCHKCPCAHFLLLDLYFSDFYTLSWWENTYNKGCPVPAVAMLSDIWTEDEKAKAQQLNCTVFDTFDVYEINDWITMHERRILSDNGQG